jgi:hypothetical protein
MDLLLNISLIIIGIKSNEIYIQLYLSFRQIILLDLI